MSDIETRRELGARRAALSICVVDDDPALVKITAHRLKRAGFDSAGTTEPEVALSGVESGRFRAVLVDIKMPQMSGHEFLERAMAIDPGVQVILVTGFYSIESAIDAIKKGASDYLCKPLDYERLFETLDEFAQQLYDRLQAQELDEQILLNAEFHGIVGKSPEMLEVFDQIRKVARHFTNILISGPTGSGKEILAHALHGTGVVEAGEFQVCACSALDHFKIENGNFRWGQNTSNERDTKSLDPAQPGTLYLDEVSELPAPIQANLLAALQTLEQNRTRAADRTGLRIITSSSHDLKAEVAAGRFREDLYFRLASVEIRVPSLSERSQDIPLLVQHFLKLSNSEYGTSFRGLTRRAQMVLLQYSWPGNVRELESTISGAMMIGSGQFIDVRDLPKHIQDPSHPRGTSGDWKPMTLAEVRRVHVDQVLTVAENLTQAAELLGIGRTSLYRMLKSRTGKPNLRKVS